MAGTARKSTHKKKTVGKTSSKSPTKAKKPRVVEINPEEKYEIETIGPVHLMWGKRRKRNNKGKVVKEWYIKKQSKQLIWVKWKQPFEDEHETNDAHFTSWSAEEQKSLNENTANKAAVEKALASKVIWPWITSADDSHDARLKLLKTGGYKEWKPVGGKKSNWKLKFAITTETDTGTTSSGSDSESTSATDNAEEEEDEV